MVPKDKPVMHFEQLEPRIMLSGDSLVNITPDLHEDTILDNTPQVVQYAQLLDTHEQGEEYISPELPSSDIQNNDIYQPIITLPVNDENIKDEPSVADLSVENIEPHQVNSEIAVLSNYSDVGVESKNGIPEDGIMPIYTNDADLSTAYATSIEIRGPPAGTTEYVGEGDDYGTVVVSGEEGETTNVSSCGLEPFVYLYEFGAVIDSGALEYGNSPAKSDVGIVSQSSSDIRIGELEGSSVVIAEDEILSGSGVYDGDLISYGMISPGNSPGIETFESLTLTGTSVIEIEIDGKAGAGIPGGWDQIQVTHEAVLDGELKIVVGSPTPSLTLGDTFEIMTYGSVVGDFSKLTGYSLGGGLYLEPVREGDKYVLKVVSEIPPVKFGEAEITVFSVAERTSLETLLNSTTAAAGSITISGKIKLDEFVYIAGSLTFSMLPSTLTVDIATGVSSDVTDPIGFGSVITDVEVLAWTLSASNMHAFVGLNGPYWINDIDSDNDISWSFNTGDGNDASRTINSMENTSITINSITYMDSSPNNVLPVNTIVTLTASDGWIEVGGVKYGDIDGDGVVDANETAELSEHATGLAITNLNFGAIFMVPTASMLLPLANISYLPRFHAVKGTAQSVEFVGFDEVVISASDLAMNVNSGRKWPGGIGPPVVDFTKSFETTPNAGDGSYTVGAVNIDFDGKRIGASADDVTIKLSQFVHITGSVAFEKGPATDVDIATGLSTDGLQAVAAVLDTITGSSAAGDTFEAFGAVIPSVAVSTFQLGASNVHAFIGLNGPYWVNDIDNNDDISWSFNTGDGNDASRTINSMENTSITINSITYTDSSPNNVLPVNTIVILTASDGWIEIGGTKYGDVNDDGIVDANETQELSEDAVGLVVTDLDVGLVTMEPTIGSFAQLFGIPEESLKGIIPKFTALKATAETFRFVGWDEIELSADAITINYQNGTEWLGALGPPVVDFLNSFPTEAIGVDDDGDGKTGEPAGFEVGTGGDPVYIDFDGNQRIGFSSERITLKLSDFVHITGSFAFEMGPVMEVNIATGLPTALLSLLGDAIDSISGTTEGGTFVTTYGAGIPNLEVSTFQIGASNVHAFIGMDGPYWVDDLDDDNNISWAFDTGNSLLFPDEASRTINSMENTSITIDSVTYTTSSGSNVLPANTIVTLEGSDGWIEIGGTKYGDVNDDGIVDANETQELSEDAVGLAVNDLDVGFVMMEPTIASFLALLPIPEHILEAIIPKFMALKATADSVEFVGFDEVQFSLQGITINYNNGSEWPGGLGPPVVDFLNSFPAEAIGVDDDGDGKMGEPAGFEVGTGGDPVYIDFDGNQRIGAIVEKVTLQIAEFVHVTGSIAFEMGPVQTVDVTGGLLSELGGTVGELLTQFGFPASLASSFPAAGATETEVSFMTIGASNVHAFIGMDGPYWVDDLDDDNNISWAFDTGNSVLFPDEASRTINSMENTSITIDSVTYTTSSGSNVLPANTIVTLEGSDGWIEVGTVKYGDIDDDDVVDPDETAELSEKAAGIVVNDFDFGMAIMTPTNPLDFARYFALRATAEQVALVGVEGVTLEATKLSVQVNQSSPSIYGLPLFPVVDFANTSQWADEELILFDTNSDGKITLGELATLNSTLSTKFAALNNVSLTDTTPVDHEMLLTILNTNNVGASRDVIDLVEAAALLGGDDAAAEAADVDSDDKIDPLGFEVDTGGAPVYLNTDSPLIRAQGFVELNIFDALYLTGSIAFEVGPTQQVTLTDGTTKTVTTMTIGAANVTAFIGANGPYWSDLDGDHKVSWTDSTGNPLTQAEAGSADGIVDVDETAELNGDAIGFNITNFDMGIMVMAATAIDELGVYLAAKASVDSFGLIGIDVLTATGKFDIALNVGLGMSGLAVVDFAASFNEQLDLFDTNDDGTITVGELRTLAGQGDYADLYSSTDADTLEVSLANIAYVLDTNMDGILTVTEAAVLATTGTAALDADADGNGKLDFGFKVNTGDPTSPVVLDFNQFLISFQLGGEIELTDVFRMYGVFLFEVDSSGLKAFVAAGLEFGPDIDSANDNKIFAMNALGALVINGDGIAADIDVSASVGGALSSVLNFNASARLVFNTTGAAQTVTIPARYVGFLIGGADPIESSLPASALYDTSQLNELTGALDDRFTENDDGSATFTISAGAPSFNGDYDAAGAFLEGGGFDAPGTYFLVSLHGDLTIASEFVITADFQLKISDDGLELGFNGTIDLGGFVSVAVEGGAVIEDGVFAAYVELAVDIDVAGINISGASVLEINTGSAIKTVFDATSGPGHDISGNTYKVSVAATIDLFGVFDATGSVEVGVVDGVFSIYVDASLSFFVIGAIDISGFINSNGSFSLTGSLDLDLTYEDFGIRGGIGVTIEDSGFSGTGSVGIVLFGKDIPIASAELSVDLDTGDFLIRAEGPLGIYLEVTPSDSSPYFSITGGLGLFDDVIGALGDAAEAVGEAVAEAAEAVADALEDLGNAILDFGSDVIDFVGGLITDIGALVGNVIGEIASWFSTSKTVNERFDDGYLDDVLQQYSDSSSSYSADESGGILTIDNSSASKLCLAIIGDDLIVDAPDVTQSVPVAEKVHYHRHWIWSWTYVGWSSWYEQSRVDIYRNVTFSNMKDFPLSDISKIVINGTDSSETIILDRNSISIDTVVYGNDGNDIIVTGKGNDLVYGGDGNDTIFTYEGNDTLYGQGDNDKLIGGTGNDELYGGSGNDLLDENYEREFPNILISETNILNGGSGDDLILGSPGIDTIEGGEGDDVLTGLFNDDNYIFKNDYGTDTFVDYFGKETLDFSGATNALDVTISENGITASAGTGHLLSIDPFVWIEQLKIGTGNDDLTITKLPIHLIDIIDEDGNDKYDFDLDQTDTAQSVCRVNIEDKEGDGDEIYLRLDSPDSPYFYVEHSGIELVTVMEPNEPPIVAADNATVTVNEGETATNTGTFSETGADTVALSASVEVVPTSGLVSSLVRFENGVDYYVGTVDTYLDLQEEETNHSAYTELRVVDNGSTQVANSLIRFEGLFGNGLNQIPLGAVIDSATLHLQTGDTLYDGTSPAAVTSIHRLLQGFDPADKYDSSFGSNGVQADGVEAVALAADVIGPNEEIFDGELVSLDVTASIQAWADGASNLGWAILQDVVNNWYFSSAQGVAPPVLEVQYRYIPQPVLTSDGTWSWSFDTTDGPDQSQTVTITATDSDGAATETTFELMVNNVAPVVEAGVDQTVNEGDVVSLNSTFTDAGSADTHTAVVDWGDGETTAVDPATSPISVDHVYADNGIYTVTVTVEDDDEGGVGSDTLEVTVNNVAPTVDAGADQTANEGSVVSLAPSSFNDLGTLDTHTATINWGDGSPVDAGAVNEAPFGPPGSTAGMNGSVAGSHVYADNGIYTVTVVVADDDSASTADTFTVTVDNIAPTVDAGPDQMVDEGQAVTLDPSSFNDLGTLDTHLATINWGDGTAVDIGVVTETPFGPPGSTAGMNGTVAGSHVYADNGIYTVTIVVTDDDSASTADTLEVTVNNVAPTVDAGADQTANEGSVVSLAPSSFNDLGTLDTHTTTINWGDGTATEVGTVSETPFGPPGSSAGMNGTVPGSHVYADNGVYTVTVTVTDDDGGVGSDTFEVTVNNVAPTLTLDPVAAIDENGVATLTGTITDPGTLDTFTLDVNWGDPLSPNDTETYAFGASATGSQTFTLTHQYLDDNPTGTASDTYTISATVTDDDTGAGSETQTVTVSNIAPTVDIASLGSGDSPFIDVGATGGNVAINNAIGQSFRVDSPTDLTKISIWIKPGLYYITSYHVEVYDSEGPSGPMIATTPTITINPLEPPSYLGVTPGVQGYYDLEFPTPATLDADHPYTFVLRSDPTDNGPNGLTNYSGAFTENSDVYPDGQLYWLGLYAESWRDMTFRLYGTASIDEGDTFAVDGSFTDPGADTWTATVDYGDGSGVQPLTLNADKTFDLNHAYADNGIYTVIVTVTDDDGGAGSDTLEVTVNNVAPTVAAGSDQTVDEGTFITLDPATFSDPGFDNAAGGTAEDFTATIDWGDGTTEPAADITLVEVPGAEGVLTTGTIQASHAYADNGIYTVTVTVTDDDGLAVSDTFTVTVANILPTLDAGADQTVDEGTFITLDPATFSDPGFDNSAGGTSEDFTATIDWGDGTTEPAADIVLTETAGSEGALTTGTIQASHAYADNGTYTVVVMVADDDGGATSDTLTVTVNNVAPTVTADCTTQEVQYSDQIQEVSFSATDPSIDTMNAETSYSIDGGELVPGLPDALTIDAGLLFDGAGDQQTPAIWTLSGIADLSPGTYIICVTVTDDDGGEGIADTEIIVNPEDAISTYVGPLFVSTLSINETIAIVELRAVIQDISFYPEDANWDPNAGNITTSTVTFINLDNNTDIAAGLPVQLIDPADSTTGVAIYQWEVDLGNLDSESFAVGIKVEKYYSSPGEETFITVSKPLQDFITGGGYLINENSAGIYAGDPGLKTNFGFNVKFNKKLTSLQGKVNAIIRKDGRLYQIKTNATLSLVVDPINNTATFLSKGNLNDITDPNNPISLGGNLSVIMTLTDLGEPGTSDSISFTVWKNEALWFSSNWTGAQTIEQVLGGGNLVVHAESLALHAADGLADEQTDGQLVTPELLEPVVEEAVLRWADYAIGFKHISTLQDVEFRIADLAGSTIGLALGNTIWLDIDAAGYGWFIDSTPWDDAEFNRRNTGSELVAKRTSEAYGDIDLLTVVMHEMGHMLGFEDLTSEAESKDLMYEILQSGVRRTKTLFATRRSTAHSAVAWHYLGSRQKDNPLLNSWFSDWLRRCEELASRSRAR